ncbi:MAG: 50S ribosomal protein L9, partial [Gammaproteobacteria bacterium]
VGSEGKLFGSVGPGDIAEALQALGLEIEKREVRMPTGPLRQVGEYDIELDLHTDIVATVRVNVISDE